MPDGFLVFDKPVGFSSHDVVAKLRGMARMRRVGHGGTLDPIATGVLPVFFGMATKAAEYVTTAADKQYIAGMRLGVRTDTQDVTGTVTDTAKPVSKTELLDAMEKFKGDIMQLPPMYSAVWKDGRRLYDLARKGIVVEREPRRISISELELLSYGDECLISVTCSKGTYIRTLVDDIGAAAGCFASMTSLRRLRAGNFRIEDAVDFETAQRFTDEGRFFDILTPTDALFADLPAVRLTRRGTERAHHGSDSGPRSMTTVMPEEGQLSRVYGVDGEFIMLGRTKDGRVKCEKMFWNVEA